VDGEVALAPKTGHIAEQEVKMTRSLSIGQLKAHLSEVVGEVQHTRTQVVIEKHGKPVAMLVPVSGAKSPGLLGLVGVFDDVPGFADALDSVVKARRTEGRRKVPSFK
jgi:prevent-host-death family protein